MNKFSDDTLFFAYTSASSYTTQLEIAGSSVSGYSIDSFKRTAYVATMNHTTSDIISLERLTGHHPGSSGQDSWRSITPYSAVDSDDIAHVLVPLATSSSHHLRSSGFDQNLNKAYDVVSSTAGGNTQYTTDFGLDNSGFHLLHRLPSYYIPV
jgi:hypothetical protein